MKKKRGIPEWKTPESPVKWALLNERLFKKTYSAAARTGLDWVDDRMKSEIRGTISDLKREPLNTP